MLLKGIADVEKPIPTKCCDLNYSRSTKTLKYHFKIKIMKQSKIVCNNPNIITYLLSSLARQSSIPAFASQSSSESSISSSIGPEQMIHPPQRRSNSRRRSSTATNNNRRASRQKKETDSNSVVDNLLLTALTGVMLGGGGYMIYKGLSRGSNNARSNNSNGDRRQIW